MKISTIITIGAATAVIATAGIVCLIKKKKSKVENSTENDNVDVTNDVVEDNDYNVDETIDDVIEHCEDDQDKFSQLIVRLYLSSTGISDDNIDVIFKTMDPECLNNVVDLFNIAASAKVDDVANITMILIDLQKAFSDPDIDFADPEIYNKYFKKYVDQYLVSGTNENSPETVEVDTEVVTPEDAPEEEPTQSIEQTTVSSNEVETVDNSLSFKEVEDN